MTTGRMSKEKLLGANLSHGTTFQRVNMSNSTKHKVKKYTLGQASRE